MSFKLYLSQVLSIIF